MAENIIKATKEIRELAESYSQLTKQIDSAAEELKVFNKTTQKTPSEFTKAIKQLEQNQTAYNKALAEATGKQKEFTAVQKESQRIVQEQIKVRAKLNQAVSKEGKELTALRLRLQQLNKVEKENAELSSKLTSEFRKQSILLNRLRLEYKNVALSQGEGSKAAKRLLRELIPLDAKLKRIEKTAGQFGRVVGNYPRLLGGAISSLRSFAAAFGFTSAIFILVQAIRSSINVFKDFDQSQADLAAITGKTKDELSELTQQARELGATTAFTATQVAKLQLELAKLGFEPEEILQATLGIENFAIATGVDAARAAKLGGAALRGFKRDVSETNEVVATLAVATTKSALTFESLEIALPKVSAIAKSFGFTIEDTTALLGGLVNAGFEASIAGTSLRQIFLQLADSNGKLAQRLGGGAKNFDELIEQFEKLNEEGISLGEAFNLTNARSVAAFKTFLSGTDELKLLRDSIIDVEDELDILAEQKLDSVQGRITLLNSAWEGWILNLDSSGEATENIKDAIDFLTKNLEKILNTVFKVGKAFIIYKAILLSGSIVMRAYTAGVTALRIAKTALSIGINKATFSLKAFNLAVKSSGLFGLFSIIAGGLAVWLSFRDAINQTAKAMEELKKQSDATTKSIIDNTIAQIEAQIAAIEIEARNEIEANEKQIELINKNIQEQKISAANLFDDLETINEIGESKINKNLEEKLIDRRELMNDYFKDLKEFEEGRLQEPPIFPEFEAVSSEEMNNLSNRGNIRTEAEREIIKRLEAMRARLIKSLDKQQESSDEKRDKKRIKLQQKIEELEIKGQIEVQNRIIKNSDNTNRSILIAIGERQQLEIELEKLKADFIINSVESTNEEIRIAQIQLQQKLNDIIVKGLIDRKQARSRVEDDEGDIDDPIGFDTRLFLINALVQAGEGTFNELQKLYDKDLEAFLKLSQDKLNVTKQFSEAQIEAISEVFQMFGQMYGADASKFLDLFTKKDLTTQDFVNAAAEASKFLVEAFTKDYTDDLNNLARKEEAALILVGDNTEAQDEIRRQFAEKERELRNKQAKADKENALFRILIDTARGVIAALTSTPPNVPLSIAVGAIGAASFTKVLATEVPQFKDGVINFEGGKAILGDGGVTEIGVLPNKQIFKSNSYDTLYDLPKGTDIYKNEDEFTKMLNKELKFNGILPPVNLYNGLNNTKNALTKDEFNKGISRLQKTLNSNESSHIIFDESGYKKYIKRNNAKINILNNRFVGRGKKV